MTIESFLSGIARGIIPAVQTAAGFANTGILDSDFFEPLTSWIQENVIDKFEDLIVDPITDFVTNNIITPIETLVITPVNNFVSGKFTDLYNDFQDHVITPITEWIADHISDWWNYVTFTNLRDVTGTYAMNIFKEQVDDINDYLVKWRGS